MKSIDTILWGRRTYGYGEGGGGGGFGKNIKNYVFTHQPPASAPRGVEFVNRPVSEFASELREHEGKDIWMMGGGNIIASFLDAGEIDEFMIHVIPTFIGDGIHLIEPRHRNIELELISSRAYDDGVVKLHYGVRRPGGAL